MLVKELERIFFDGRSSHFERFELELELDDALSCSHAGPCDGDVAVLACVTYVVDQLREIPAATIAAELAEYGAWDASELEDEQANWHRVIWLASCDIRENEVRENG